MTFSKLPDELMQEILKEASLLSPVAPAFGVPGPSGLPPVPADLRRSRPASGPTPEGWEMSTKHSVDLFS